MVSLEQQILSAVDAVFSSATVSQEDRQILATVQREIKHMDVATRKRLLDQILVRSLPVDQPIPLYFYLYDCFEDIRLLEAALPYLPATLGISQFYEVFWNFSQRLFTATAGSAAISAALREKFTHCAAQLRAFLNDRQLLNMPPHPGVAKRIAIISPQILGMTHSPSREAFNIALHLTQVFGCECYVVNCNAMHYEHVNTLGLVSISNFSVNADLQGHQAIDVDYMGLKGKIQVISFAADAMTTQKIARIVDTLRQLQVDAVISHGENLLVTEALHGVLPTLFATTGSVVPYAHCDAYFIPGDLFNSSSQATADQYGHTDFMMESMLVTPQGKASAPLLRSTFGLDEEALVFVVAGTRLQSEVTTEFARTCEQLLSQLPHAVILFAGTRQLDLATKFNPSLIAERRVVNVGFRQDFPELCAMCNVFLNPPRQGGGTSAQTAIINGLAVVTLNQGHISAIMPAHLRQASWAHYLDYAMALSEREYRAVEAEQLQKHYYTHCDARLQIEKMLNKLNELSQRYKHIL